MTADIAERFITLENAIDEAVHSLQNDVLTDVSSFEGAITSLCSDIESAPAEEAAQFESSMARIISRLDKLANELQVYQDRHEEINKEQS